MHERPLTDLKAVVLDSLDGAWQQLSDRLTGLDDAEYLWEPVADSWSVRLTTNGAPTIDGAGDREIDPAPVTTIAWRLWHIAVDCLDSYSERLLGQTGASVSGNVWHLDASDAVGDLERSWECFRSGIGGFSDDQLWTTLGGEFGPFSDHSRYDLALHALHEVTHHGAEIALLRDLYRVFPR